jgi:hypothetical protein
MKKHCNTRSVTKRGQLTFEEALMLELSKSPARMNAYQRYVYSTYQPAKPAKPTSSKKWNPRTLK